MADLNVTVATEETTPADDDWIYGAKNAQGASDYRRIQKANLFAGSGNVGIGTASPVTKLEINESVNAGVTLQVTNLNAGTSATAGLALKTDGMTASASMGGFSSGYSTVPNWANSVGFLGDTGTPGGLFFWDLNKIRFQNNPGVDAVTIISEKVGIGVVAPAGKLDVDQSSATGAIPVLRLDQADVSEEMIEFESTIGTGNAIEAVGAKTLTTTHFIKVTLTGGLTRYLPVGTIA